MATRWIYGIFNISLLDRHNSLGLPMTQSSFEVAEMLGRQVFFSSGETPSDHSTSAKKENYRPWTYYERCMPLQQQVEKPARRLLLSGASGWFEGEWMVPARRISTPSAAITVSRSGSRCEKWHLHAAECSRGCFYYYLSLHGVMIILIIITDTIIYYYMIYYFITNTYYNSIKGYALLHGSLILTHYWLFLQPLWHHFCQYYLLSRKLRLSLIVTNIMLILHKLI